MGVLGVRAASAAGGADGVGAGPGPEEGAVGFTASSRFHMGNLHLSENGFSTFRRATSVFRLIGPGQYKKPVVLCLVLLLLRLSVEWYDFVYP